MVTKTNDKLKIFVCDVNEYCQSRGLAERGQEEEEENEQH